MSEHLSRLNSIQTELTTFKDSFSISGLKHSSFLFLHKNVLKLDIEKDQVFVFRNNDEAHKAFKSFGDDISLFFPGLGVNPYSSIVPSQALSDQRYFSLQKIERKENNIKIFTSYEALHLKQAPKSYFSSDIFSLNLSDIISPEELKTKLTKFGYQYTPTIEEPGTFSNKGEIFDIYTFDKSAVRIHYFDDMIEEMFSIDLETLKTNRELSFEKVEIQPNSLELLHPESILKLRNKLYKPSPGHTEKIKYRNEIFHKLNNNFYFDRFPVYLSGFFDEHASLLDYLSDPQVYFFNKSDQKQEFSDYMTSLENDYSEELKDSENPFVSLSPSQIYFEALKNPIKSISINELAEEESSFQFKFQSISAVVKANYPESVKDKFEFLKSSFLFVKKVLANKGKVFIIHKNLNTKIELEYLLEQNEIELNSQISFIQDNLDEGFYDLDDNTVYLSESDLFSRKIKKSSKHTKKSQDVFADQLSTLKKGDYVIHKNHGVGRYLGMESLDIANQKGDFLILEYEGDDKVYVPVYKLDLIQKHSEGSREVKLANLNSKKFEQQKSKARSSVKKLAFDLLEIQAKRESQKGFAFSPNDYSYKEFERAFMFEETEDQLSAIDDVISDMEEIKPMDRLVCGDVGFGKTEVAMRAAFKAILDNKQVAILVPTTVLALQHYNSFLKRFKNFPVEINFLSRFKTAKQIKEITTDLEAGKIDIIIGTHKLLGESIKYKDLGLLVIDEEQRFGVAHKEKLKLLKSNIDCLTLTATPIPRTLQLSFLGIKDLSIIRSAPPSRQSIKSYVIKEDPNTIRAAISKELTRGGQIFVVHNRVHDIENYAAYIQKLAPEARIIVAHGQLAERELEKRIKKFYDHEFDILVSTTIIESGIDIPSANTLIIDKANHYGLSQLHQLRGRIGRSDKKAYAYFITPHDKNLSDIARKRLKALQTYADLGSGFSLATNDLEIRGSGDILGAEQSGHIAEIGLELYMDLLKQAINDLKGTANIEKRDIEINTPFSAFIPESYIRDTGLRLKYYKRLSNSTTLSELDEIIDELTDQYGLLPKELQELYLVLKSKIHLSPLPIKSLRVSKSHITIKFDQELVNSDSNIQSKIVQFFMERPKVYKLSPSYSVQCKFKSEVSINTLVEFSEYVASQILPC